MHTKTATGKEAIRAWLMGIAFLTASMLPLTSLGGESADVSPAPPRDLIQRWDSAPRLERLAIAQALRTNRKASLPALREVLIAGTASQKKMACSMLREARDKEAESALIQGLNDPSEVVQTHVVTTLGYLGGQAAKARIRNRIRNADGGLLKACLAALGRLRSTEDIPLLRQFLTHEDESVRVNAAASLAYLGLLDGKDVLLSATRSSYPQACREATYALGFLGTPEAIQRLEEVLADPRAHWKTEARIALATVQIRGFASESDKVDYLSSVASDPNRHLAQWAVIQVADIDTTEALAALTACSIAIGRTGMKTGELLGEPRLSPPTRSRSINFKHAKSVHQYLCDRAFERISNNFYDSGVNGGAKVYHSAAF